MLILGVFSFEIIVHCQIKFSGDINTITTMLVLALDDWEFRTFTRAFVLQFGVAGKPSLIMLSCCQDFHVDRGSLNGTEMKPLLFSLCFSNSLSADDLFVDGVLLSCISEFLSFRFRLLSFNFIP